MIFSFFSALLILFPPCLSSAETNEAVIVTATGVAAISGSNTAAAREAAINDALRKAVEQTVGTMVSSDTMVGNYQVLKDTVYTKAQGYVKNYSIQNESQGQGVYRVTLSAEVAVKDIKNDLDAAGLLNVRAERPRVLFMIAEQNIGQKYYNFWWLGKSEFKGETTTIPASETTLKEIFLKKGFTVVDISGSTGRIKIDNALRVEDLSNEGAVSIGGSLNAEIVIKGKALAEAGPRTPGGSVGVYLADVAAQAIRVDTGEVLASAGGHATARNISGQEGGREALSRASEAVADKMIEQILAKWSQGNNIIIKISNVTDYKNVADFKDVLREQMNGIKAVYQRKYDGGEAIFEVDSRVPAHDIADEISRLPGTPYRVINTTPNTIEITVNEPK